MKVGGIQIAGPKKTTVVLPRSEGDIPFHFVGVTDGEEFDKMFPEPEPPVEFNVKLQAKIKLYNDPKFLMKQAEWVKAKTAWFFLKSIESSNIEWETVDWSKPETFANWQSDFKKAGFNQAEVNRIYAGFEETNMVTEELMKQARERFLASQEAIPLSVGQ